MEFPADSPLLRIGDLSRRFGVSDHVLRAWANRYGLLQLQRNGWRIGYLGAGTPVEELERAVASSHPDLAVLAAAQIATAAGAPLMAGDPVTEVERAGWSR
jgi:hypothetical protein